LFCQWLPLHQLDENMLRIIVRTFLEIFPDGQAWLLHLNVDIPVLGWGEVWNRRITPTNGWNSAWTGLRWKRR